MPGGNSVYPIKVIAELFGITERRVNQLAQKKIIPKAGKGVFDLGPTIQAYIRYLHGLMNGAISADASELNQRLLQARTHEREAIAALRQMEHDERQGKLILLEDIKRRWSSRLLEFKAALLEMPKLVAFRFTDPDIRMHVEEELNIFVVEILTRYSRDGIYTVGDGNNTANTQAAAVDNRKRVGRRKQNTDPKGKPTSGTVEDKPYTISP